MKPASILILLFLFSCKKDLKNSEIQVSKREDTIIKDNNLKEEKSSKIDSITVSDLKNYKVYKTSDTIFSDINCDGIKDKVFFKNLDSIKVIAIIDGKSQKQTIVGNDKSFRDMGKDFSWIDFWGITSDKTNYEITFNEDNDIEGDRTANLNCNSIFVRKEEVGGGIITFKNGKYVWIHQSD